MRSIIEGLRGARHIAIFACIVLISVLALTLTGGRSLERTAGNDLERRLEQLLEAIDGVGRVSVMISRDDAGRTVGVAVVARGRLDVRTRLEMQSAIRALLDIDLQRIRIIGKGG